ncbi:DUF2169 domain-containing protein [Mesorhizobium sp. C280B]|uniref:DUF2169 family type VI secretion system accessory protein n=1 Tax=unclassified Mesorhizobium TaxID=325217 RepID=UPI0003CDE470|nr:DUF2169 domain-containing protein [Mesorhizobium sp. LSJC280B00]ESW80699.1 hypothetical protein X772_24155 [Mesorhizobium sp. LSJC280B00]
MFVSQNTTPFLAETFPYQDKDCVKHCVAVIRATFDVDPDGNCTPSKEQSPFVYADTHYGDPEVTSIRVETDFAPVKPKCEVLLDAMAVAPQWRQVEAIDVRLVGPGLDKRAIVTGQRRWFRGGLGIQASRPTPFVSIPLAWHLAFGGTDRTDPDPAKHRSDAVNPIGSGYLVGQSNVDGTLLPSVEHPQSRMRIWNDRPRAIGFGPVPRFAKERARYAGTYDKHWMENVLPFLPQDFDDRYFQAAPQDQWLDKLGEGMIFGCLGMNESGKFKVKLPAMSVAVRFMFHDRTEHKVVAPDTLTMLPHEGRIVLVGRASTKLPRKFVKLLQVQVGKEREPIFLKPHYAGLKEAVAALAGMRKKR